MKRFIQISVLIIAVQWCSEVKCKPFVRKKHIYKSFHLGVVPIPPKHFSVVFEKFTPFGTYEFKHAIKKRQIAPVEIPPVTNEVLAAEDDPLKIPMTHLIEKTEVKDVEKLPAKVLITSVVEPLEPGKHISFLLPVDSEVAITPAVKDVVAPAPLGVEVPVGPEAKLKPEVVAPPSSAIVEITPKPIEILPPPEIKPIEPKVVLTTPIESTVPPVPPVPPVVPVPMEKPVSPVPPPPAGQNLKIPVISPVINSIPIVPFLYTSIKGIPFYTPAANVIPFITPAAVPIPEAVLPPGPPPVIKEVVPVVKEEKPPVVKEEVPLVVKEEVPLIVKEEVPLVVKDEVPLVVKEEIPPVVKEEIPPVVKEEPPPNFFVKSSRFVLYMGSMMLQMLSRFVNGEINLNRIPVLPPLPGIQ